MDDLFTGDFLSHALAEHYGALRRIKRRRELLASPLWQQIGGEVERVTTAVEVAHHRAPTAPSSERLRVAAWNIQRGLRLPELLRQLRSDPVLRDADVLLLVEVDHGLGRSGNRHVARELAAGLGMHYAFGVNYLTLEDDFLENPDGAPNTTSLAGNAILSRWPIGRVINVDLPELRDKFSSSEKRLGKKKALVAELRLPSGSIAVAASHLDSNASSRQRAQQLAGVLDAAESLGAPALVGGDFNTTTYDVSSKLALVRDLLHKLFVTGFAATVNNYMTPERRYEQPIFALLAARGYATEGWNDRQHGTMVYDFNHPYAQNKVKKNVGGLLLKLLLRLLRPWGGVVPAKLDWFCARGLLPSACHTIAPERAGDGAPASDHAAIVCDVALSS